MKKLRYLLLSAGLAAWLLLSVFSAFAVPTLLDNGDFETGDDTSWSKGPLSFTPDIDLHEGCLDGYCWYANLAGYYLHQTVESPSQFIVVGGYITAESDADEACFQVRRSGSLIDDVCAPAELNGSEWVWGCIDLNTAGSAQIRVYGPAAGAYVDNVFVDYADECPDEVIPPGSQIPFTIPLTTTCVITVGTQIITDELGVTSTVDITAVVPADIVNNPSFEDPSDSPQFPSYWQFSNPLDAFGVYAQAQPSSAYNGDDALKFSGRGNLNVSQMITVPSTAGGWQIGMHIRPVDMEELMGVASISFQGATAYSDLETCGYSGTIEGVDVYTCNSYLDARAGISATTGTTGTDSIIVSLPDMRLLEGAYWIDDIYAIPTDEGGLGASCPAVQEYYNGGAPLPVGIPPSTGYPGEVVGGIPIPIFGAGNVCYECRYPGQDATVQMHIVWQTCILRNMFSCDLPPMLWAIENGARAAGVGILNLGSWIANNAQAAVTGMWTFFSRVIEGYNGVAYYLSNTPQQIYILIYTAEQTAGSGIDWFTLLWEVVLGIFWLIATLLGYLFDALAGLLSLAWYAIGAIFGAISAPPLSLAEFVELEGGSVPSGSLGSEGYSEYKMYVLFLWTLAIFDEQLPNNGLMPFISFATGVMGFGILMWVLGEWRKIIPSV